MFVAALAALAVHAAGVSATTAVAKTRHRVAVSLVGAQIGPGEFVFEVHGTARGALVELFKTNSTATAGTNTTTFYDGHGTIVSRGGYTLSPPDDTGIVALTGTGRYVSGTGKYKGIKGTYKANGTINARTTVTSLKVVGTQTY